MGDYSLVKDRFSTYILPGRVDDPLRSIEEAGAASDRGLGGVWLSERFALKEPAVIAGLLAGLPNQLRIGATFYAQLRHPVVIASIANLMQAITRERFLLVLARASPQFFAGYGAPPLTLEYMEDCIGIYRSLWRGETVNYHGIVGRFENLRLSNRYEGNAPPVIFTAMGPKALAFGGTHCDGVLLHPMLTPEAVCQSAEKVRKAAADAGRDPADIRIIANVMVAPDLSEEAQNSIIRGRAVTYLQSRTLGPLLTQLNGWDSKVLDKLRNHASIRKHAETMVSEVMTRKQLVDAGELIPDHWIETGTVCGSADVCAKKLCAYLDAGADEILLHGSPPSVMEGLVRSLATELPKRQRL